VSADRVPPTIKPPVRRDLRTRSGREEECLEQIREYGGFSCFWATEFLTRAHALQRLIDSKRIRTRTRMFPWTDAKIVAPNTRLDRQEEARP
jgi:hypothetical protein